MKILPQQPKRMPLDPDDPLESYLSLEQQAEHSLSVHCVAVTLAARREGKHLDDVRPTEKIHYENAATLAWLWRDPVLRILARQYAEDEVRDEVTALGLDCDPNQAESLARIAVDAFERRLLGLDPVDKRTYEAMAAHVAEINHERAQLG